MVKTRKVNLRRRRNQPSKFKTTTPTCNHLRSTVIKKYKRADGTIDRLRYCVSCNARFVTIETLETARKDL